MYMYMYIYIYIHTHHIYISLSLSLFLSLLPFIQIGRVLCAVLGKQPQFSGISATFSARGEW